jgi:hypothetical protein
MGWLQDLLQEVPLSGVLRERVQLAEQKYSRAMAELEECKQRLISIERENESLRASIPKTAPQSGFQEGTIRVLVHLFKASGY